MSSVSPCVGNGPPHQQPTCHVEERQAASLGLGSHDGDDLVNTLWSLALVWPPLILLLLLGSALTRCELLDAEAFQETG